MARSSTEAKYYDLDHTTFELIWLESLLEELIIPFLPPALLCDNLGAFLLSYNPNLHAYKKHIELDIHFVHACVISKRKKIQHVPSFLQLTDTLRSPLAQLYFRTLRLSLKSRHLSLLELMGEY